MDVVLKDIKGVPIRLGDLVRTNHFKDRTDHGTQRYLYHVVMNRSGHLEFVPFPEAMGWNPDGGCFWYIQSAQTMLTLDKAVVLTGIDWPWDRKK